MMLPQINTTLIRLLTQAFPEINTGQIGVYHPHDRGEITLGLHLYSIRACHEITPPPVTQIGRNIKTVPPRFVALYYLMTAYSKAELAYRAAEECRIIERAMQVFEQYPVLTESILGCKPGKWIDELKLEFTDLDRSEIAGIWEHQETPLRLSVGYRVFPVEIPREFGLISERVRGIDVKTNQP
ncbi:MAG: DUF4255 domain-containing protein [Oscillospiraceae bacterium]|nr:DUF4255 domain-containing protein [Oscillospiraceae bacterium]